jgi:hypothetical protein
MSPSASSNQRNDSNRSEVLHERDRSLRNVARNGTLLDIAEDEHLTRALRLREDAFNEDVLPAGAELKAPQDFYVAMEAERAMRSQKQPSPKQIAGDKGTMIFPHLAA